MSMFSVRTLYYRVSYLKFNQPTIATKQNKHAWMECAALCAAEAQIFQWFAGIVLSCHRFLWKVRGKLHEVRNDLWHDLPQHDHRVWEKTESRWYDQTCPSVWIWICHLLRDKVIKSYLVWDETTSFPFYDIKSNSGHSNCKILVDCRPVSPVQHAPMRSFGYRTSEKFTYETTSERRTIASRGVLRTVRPFHKTRKWYLFRLHIKYLGRWATGHACNYHRHE